MNHKSVFSYVESVEQKNDSIAMMFGYVRKVKKDAYLIHLNSVLYQIAMV